MILFTVRALIYFLVLDPDKEIYQRQLQYLASAADHGIYQETIKLSKRFPDLKIMHRLPLLDIALSTLRQLSKQQYLLFKKNLNTLIAMDNRIQLFEWAMQKILFHHLDSVFGQITKQKLKHLDLKQTQHACAVVLSLLVYAGKQYGVSHESIFASARKKAEWLGY